MKQLKPKKTSTIKADTLLGALIFDKIIKGNK